MTLKWETREEWGSLPIEAGSHNTTQEGIVVHWGGAGSYASSNHDNCRKTVRGIQKYHVSGEYYDIAYGSIVCSHGIVMEGRVRQDDPEVRVGSNGTLDSNTKYGSVLVLRGDDDGPVTDLEIDTLAELIAWYRTQWYGKILLGHRDIVSTACPGNDIYRRLPEVKDKANDIIADKEEDVALTDEEIERIANRTVAKLMQTKFQDGAFDKDSPYFNASFVYLMSRIANRSHNANVNAQIAAMASGKEDEFVIVAEDDQIVVKRADDIA